MSVCVRLSIRVRECACLCVRARAHAFACEPLREQTRRWTTSGVNCMYVFKHQPRVRRHKNDRPYPFPSPLPPAPPPVLIFVSPPPPLLLLLLLLPLLLSLPPSLQSLPTAQASLPPTPQHGTASSHSTPHHRAAFNSTSQRKEASPCSTWLRAFIMVVVAGALGLLRLRLNGGTPPHFVPYGTVADTHKPCSLKPPSQRFRENPAAHCADV